MRTRTFSEVEKEEIKLKMMEAGMPLLKEKGMTHMSITKITEAVGIGKSTFYSFYATKENFVLDMLGFHRKKILESFKSGLKGKVKYAKEESINLIRDMISNAGSVYQNISHEDEMDLKKMLEKNGTTYLDLEREIQVINYLSSMMEGVKEDLDYSVISNLIKIIVFTSEQRDMLHVSGYERTINQLVDLLIQNIFE